MNVIYFRVDGNSDIATGHLMRCLAIARACTQAGRQHHGSVQISFLVSDEQSRSLLTDRFEMPAEFPIYTLSSDYRNMEAEIPALVRHITCKAANSQSLCDVTSRDRPWLFVDSYFASPKYFDMLRKYCRIAYLDDLRSFDCPVDLIINYDTDQDCPHYARAAHKLLGVRYTPLRTQFASPGYDVRSEAGNVLLSTGGTDPYGIAGRLLRIIYDRQIDANDCCLRSTHTDAALSLTKQVDFGRLKSLHYHIVTSRANTHCDSLIAMAGENPHIHIYENVTDMASLMASCDLAVSAGGTTLFELCAVGVPTICYLMADNQRTAVEIFSAREIIPCAGDIRPSRAGTDKNSQTPQPSDGIKSSETDNLPSEAVIYNILLFMTQMSLSAEARQKSSHTMRAFLDGRGAERIAGTLLSL